MSKALSTVSLSQAIWKGTNTYGVFRYISSSKGMVLLSGNVIKPIVTSDADILLHNLKNATSLSSLLRIVSKHHGIMNIRHILQAFRSIFDLKKDESLNHSKNDLLRHPDFEKLCSSLKPQSGIMELRDALEALKVLSFVGVPSTSTITQVLLQLIRQNINSLSLQQIMYLDFLLRNFQKTPLVEALNIALPLIFDIHLPIKMDRQSIRQVTEFLQYSSKAKVSVETVDLIVNTLLNYPGEFDVETAKSIIWSITDMRFDKSFEPLFTKAVTDIVINIDELNLKDMELTLKRIINKYTTKTPFYYQEVFFDSCVNYVIDHNLELKDAAYFLRNLARTHHYSKTLLDYVSTLVYHNPTTMCDAADIYSIVISLVLTEYKPVHWENLKKFIENAKDLAEQNRREIIWIRFAAALCLLDIYKIDVLSKALSPRYLSHLLVNKGFLSDFENYFAIWHSIKVYNPNLANLLPSNMSPENIINLKKAKNEFPLEAALQKGLGGDQFLLTNIYSKMGVTIDHAIVFRKGGDPKPIENRIKFIEELNVEKDSQLVLILALSDFHYTINTKMIRLGILRIKNILEKSLNNCSVVLIGVPAWEELNDFEKIPYLMQHIKNKLECDFNASESVL